MTATSERSGKTNPGKPKLPAKILHQTYFKSVGPRTYAAQVKELSNGNHMLVLIEGRRDEKTDELRKTQLCVFSEDFPAFFNLVKQSAGFIDAHPVPDEVRQRRQKYWGKQRAGASAPGRGQ